MIQSQLMAVDHRVAGLWTDQISAQAQPVREAQGALRALQACAAWQQLQDEPVRDRLILLRTDSVATAALCNYGTSPARSLRPLGAKVCEIARRNNWSILATHVSGDVMVQNGVESP